MEFEDVELYKGTDISDQEVIRDPEAKTADFNSRAYGAPFGKPARRASFLPGLSGLHGTCTGATPYLTAGGSNPKQGLACYACRGPGPTYECRKCGSRFCQTCMVKEDGSPGGDRICFLCHFRGDSGARLLVGREEAVPQGLRGQQLQGPRQQLRCLHALRRTPRGAQALRGPPRTRRTWTFPAAGGFGSEPRRATSSPSGPGAPEQPGAKGAAAQ